MASNVVNFQQNQVDLQKGQRNEMRMIARAAKVMRAIAETPTGLSLGQIAKSTGLARSTVQRLIGALEAEGFVSTEAGQVGAKLGLELVRLGATALADVRQLFRPFMERLQLKIGETVELTRLSDVGPVVIEQITSSESLRVSSYVGRHLPMHCTAAGKAHLMMMTAQHAKNYVTSPLKKYTQNTLVIIKEAIAVANTHSAFAFAYEHDEFLMGVSAIAVPVKVPGGENHTLVISMPTLRFDGRVQQLRDELRQSQRAIETAARI